MNIRERIEKFDELFDCLQSTTSRLEKEGYVNEFTRKFPELIDDWTYILETLDGKHPIGWTFRPVWCIASIYPSTIRYMIESCEKLPDRCNNTTSMIEQDLGEFGAFIAPIVNRTLKLGIGKSLLSKSDITPMLAKKYEGGPISGEFAVTEKLDGNRCVASFDRNTGLWRFTSRSGKPMRVNFDMSAFDPDLIYDGEVMSQTQTELSEKRYDAIFTDTVFDQDTKEAQLLFNTTSGLINRHGNKTGLVYNVFDVISDANYKERREMLSKSFIHKDITNVRLLPVLYYGDDTNKAKNLLGHITQMGGEGVMLNKVNRGYEHKRSDALLKYKQVQFMDMVVTGIYPGTGKYTGLVGGLNCAIHTVDGKDIYCDVGSGLSDEQRYEWMVRPNDIVGHIVQIGYHELTQSEYNLDTNVYSLRFPRLVKVRLDKNDTSEF